MSESFAELLEESLGQTAMRPDQTIMAEVIDKAGDYVIVHAGLKSEAEIPISEFRNDLGDIEVEVGDRVEVIIIALEDGQGRTRLSREKACMARTWEKLEKSFEEQTIVMGRVTSKVKGGFTVMINNIRAFLPGSLVDVRSARSRDSVNIEGMDMEFKLIKLDRSRNNLVVSRRAVMETELSAERKALMDSLEEGQMVKGVVKNLTEFGAFVNLGGIDGLLHVTDMAWRRIRHPSEVLDIGDELEVKVLKFDREKNRVSLGLKQMGEDPWLNIESNYPAGHRSMGKVTNITDYGAFVQLTEGVEGLVHVSEMSWSNKNINPARFVTLGDEVEVMVLDADGERHRISLGMKQCLANPWQEFAALHKKGDKVTGAIKSITDFGVFIGLENGIDGLIHLSDLSWDAPGEEVVHNFHKGDELTAVVMAIDPERERISLGYKQVSEDPFASFISYNGKGSVVTGKITSVDSNKAIVELTEGIEGMLRASEISREHVADATTALTKGQEVESKIISIDRKSRRIGLSIKALSMDIEKQALQEYSEQEQPEALTLGGLFKEKLFGKKKSAPKEEEEKE